MRYKKLLFILAAYLISSCSKAPLENEQLNHLAIGEKLSTTPITPTLVMTGPFNVLGNGYDVTGRYAEESSAGYRVIDVNRFNQDFPARVVQESPLIQEYTEDYGENAEQYSKSISNKVSATAGFKLFGLSISSSFNSSNDQSSSFDAKYIYGNYQLQIKQKRYRLNSDINTLKNYLTPEFVYDLQNKSVSQLIQDYGTHVMTDIYIGGKFQMTYQSETKNQNRTLAARSGIKVGAKKVFNVEVSSASSIDENAAQQNFSKRLAYKSLGGDPTKEIKGEINLDFNPPTINLASWQNSITPSNSVLVDFGQYGLIPIYELISDPIKKNELTSAVLQHLANRGVSNIHTRVPVYGLYLDGYRYFRNSKMDNHIFSLYPYEEDPLMTNEGVVFYAYTTQKPGTVPVYRYQSASINDNFFTTDNRSYTGYVYERIAFYAYPNANAATYPLKPVYRYWSATKHLDHYQTTVKQNYPNYTYEFIDFYVPQ